MRQRVRQRKRTHHRGQRGDVEHVVRQPVAAQGLSDQIAHPDTGQRADRNQFQEHHQCGTHGTTGGARRHQKLIHQHGQQRADRIDHDAFPAQHVGNVHGRAHRAQHGDDHGRPGHHHHRAKQGGQAPRNAGNPLRGQSHDHPGHQRAGGHKAAHHRLDATNFGKFERQAAFEQDHRHGQRHEGEQQVTQQGVRVKPSADRPGDDAGNQQKQDRRQTHPPGQPLAGAADNTDGSNCRNGCISHTDSVKTGVQAARARISDSFACPRSGVRALQ